MKAINCSLLILMCLGGFMGILYMVFDPLIQHIILNRLVLRNHSQFAQIWENPPITPHLKVYFFNLTNAQQFFDGRESPNLEEVGPYVFHEKWSKEDVSWHDNATMSYRTRKTFKFVREMSVGDYATDKITTLNVPAISAMYQKRNAGWLEQVGLAGVLDWGLAYDMWMTKTVEDLVWGYNETLFEYAELTGEKMAVTKFGFFVQPNATTDLPKYTMYTGQNNPYQLSKISLFNGRDSLEKWGDDRMNRCNKVQGSDGATFNPYIKQDDTLWFFNDQLCQSMPLDFQRKVESAGGLPGFRFSPREDVFKLPKTKNDPNACFCQDEPLCDVIGDGMFAVSRCQMDAPIVLSWPHFLGVENQTHLDAVRGLRPNKEEHEFYFDVQPTTGTTLSARARIQINLAVLNIPAFTKLSKVNTTVVPLLWFDEGLDELGPELRDHIAVAVIDPPVYKGYILIGLACVIGVIVVVGAVSAYVTCRSRISAKRQHRFEAYVDDEEMGGGGKMQAGAILGKGKDDKIREVRQFLNDKIGSAGGNGGGGGGGSGGGIGGSGHGLNSAAHSTAMMIHRNLGASEEVHMRLLESGSTTESSSKNSSATHSRNSSTGSNISPAANAAANAALPSSSQPQPGGGSSDGGSSSSRQSASDSASSVLAGNSNTEAAPATTNNSSIPEVSSSQALLDPDTRQPNV